MKAKEAAYAPYSNFKVGAVILTASGRTFTGANIENGSYSLTICAERVALYRAIMEGERDFIAIAIATDSKSPAFPCGSCLQTLSEFGSEIEIWLKSGDKGGQRFTLSELLPKPFHFEPKGKGEAPCR